MSNPLTIIPAQKVIDETNVNTDFSALSDSEKLEVINTSSQEVCSTYNNNQRQDYLDSNLATPLPPVEEAQERAGFGTAKVGGNPVVFSSPLPDANYVVTIPTGVDYINPNTQADTRTTVGFTAFSAFQDIVFGYICKEPV